MFSTPDLNWYSSCAKLMKTSVTQFESYKPKGARRARQRGGNLQSGWGCQNKQRPVLGRFYFVFSTPDLNWYSSCAKLMKTSVTQFESYKPKGARRARQRGGNLQSGWGCQKFKPTFWVGFIFNNGKISTQI